MPIMYFESLITVYKNVFIDQLTAFTDNTVSKHFNLIIIKFNLFILCSHYFQCQKNLTNLIIFINAFILLIFYITLHFFILMKIIYT